jgi:hypothetical protein
LENRLSPAFHQFCLMQASHRVIARVGCPRMAETERVMPELSGRAIAISNGHAVKVTRGKRLGR